MTPARSELSVKKGEKRRIPPTVADGDGRQQRGARNRDAVVDAVLGLLRDGELRPGGQQIAERAGVSLRTVFRHFDDLDSIMEAAVRQQLDHVGSLFDLPSINEQTALRDRIDTLARHRERLYEEIAPVRRAATRLAPFHQAIRDALASGHRRLRHHLEVTFAPELGAMPATNRRATLDAADAACSFATWDAMRTDQRLSANRARATLAHALERLFQ